MKNILKTNKLNGFVETKVLIVIIVAFIAVIAGAGLLLSSNNSSDQTVNEVVNEVTTESEVVQETSVEDNSMNQKVLDSEIQVLSQELNAPEKAFIYRLVEGSEAYYKVIKTYVGKPGEAVMGTSKEVVGVGYVLVDDNTGKLIVESNINDFSTDSSKRDADILPLFTDRQVRFTADLTDLNVDQGQPFTLEVPGSLTINGVTNEVVFNVQGELTDDVVNATGTTKIMMTDYGVTAPSLLGVFSVADELEVGFTIVGEAL